MRTGIDVGRNGLFLVVSILLLCVLLPLGQQGDDRTLTETSANTILRSTFKSGLSAVNESKVDGLDSSLPLVHGSNDDDPSINNTLAQCWRKCSHYDNKIILTGQAFGGVGHNVQPGLNDRAGRLRNFMNLAGYLCATLYVLPPNLTPMHSDGSPPLGPNASWFDLLDLRTMPLNETLVVEYQEGLGKVVTEHDRNSTVIVKTEPDATMKYKEKNIQVAEDFETVERISWQDADKQFVWVIRHGAIAMEAAIARHLTRRQNSSKAVMFPSIRNKAFYDGCAYSRIYPPNHMQAVVDSVWQHIRKHSSHEMIGYLHLRRGDATEVCDTSLPAIEEYLRCSFEGMENKTTLLFSSDEKSAVYRGSLQSLVERRYAQFFDLDNLVRRAVQDDIQIRGAPVSRANNYYIYHAIKAVSMRTSYQLARRRDFQCPVCEKVSSLPQKLGLGLEVNVGKRRSQG